MEGAKVLADQGEPVAVESPWLTEAEGWWQAAATTLGTEAPVWGLEIFGSHLMKWREWRVTEEDEGEDWSYSTIPVGQELEQLRERLNRMSFQDGRSWLGWEVGGRAPCCQVEPYADWGSQSPAS